MKKIVVWGLAGFLIFVFGFLSGSFWATKTFFSSFSGGSFRGAFDEPVMSSRDMQSQFYEYIFWGAGFNPTKGLAPLPEGAAKLEVKFNNDDNPAAGIGFSLVLNEKYRTGLLKTDANGVAQVLLPFGQWELNRLECRQWSKRPEGNFIIVSGDEPKLGTVPLKELFYSFGGEAKMINLSKNSKPSYVLPVEIRKRIKVLWPQPGELKQDARVTSSVIKWEPYPKAASYAIQINRVTREKPRTTTFSPLVHKHVTGVNALLISELANVESDLAPHEYAVEIRAYDQGGAFLSESEHGFSTFRLMDNHVLVKFNGGGETPIDHDDIEDRFNAGKGLDAAVLLIEKKMYAEAARLLEQIDTSILPGRAAMLKGYLHASRGSCEKAYKYFEESLSHGQKCIPEKYRLSCNKVGISGKK